MIGDATRRAQHGTIMVLIDAGMAEVTPSLHVLNFV
jgi:hypothetical protein